MNSAHFDAQRDIALSEEYGLAALQLDTSVKLLPILARGLSPVDVLKRIKHSRYPTEMLVQLPSCVGNTRTSLDPYMTTLSTDEELIRPNNEEVGWIDAVAAFADIYWTCVVQERIVRGDFRRAYAELNKAAQFEPVLLSAGHNILERLVNSLFVAMTQRGIDVQLPLEKLYFLFQAPGIKLLSHVFPGEFSVHESRIGWGRSNTDSWSGTTKTLSEAQRRTMALSQYFRELEKQKRRTRTSKKIAQTLS
jgi:hypothetical protein